MIIVLIIIFFLQMSNLQQQRLVVEQLRREANIKRITVRQAVSDIMVFIPFYFIYLMEFLYFFVIFSKKYVMDHQQDDYLMVGFSSQKANPFREKSSCSLLWPDGQNRQTTFTFLINALIHIFLNYSLLKASWPSRVFYVYHISNDEVSHIINNCFFTKFICFFHLLHP